MESKSLSLSSHSSRGVGFQATIFYKKIGDLTEAERFQVCDLANIAGQGSDTYVTYITISGKIVAVILSEIVDGHKLYVSNLFVSPSHRRHGYAKALLKHCEEFARKERCDLVYLVVVNKNEPAKALYSENGYTVNKDIVYFLGTVPKRDASSWTLESSTTTSCGLKRRYNTPLGVVTLYESDGMCYVICHFSCISRGVVGTFLSECQGLSSLPLRVKASLVSDGYTFFSSLGWDVESLIMSKSKLS